MSAGSKAVLEAAMKLDPTEREQVAQELLESLDASSAESLGPEWEAEIARRLREVEAGSAEFVSGDDVFARANDIVRGSP